MKHPRQTSAGRHRTCRRTAFIAAMALLALPASGLAAGATWTSDADFDTGSLVDVNHDSPNGDQLQLNDAVTSTFPVLWVANAGEDTVSKIDTNTNTEIGRYCVGLATIGQQGCTGTHGAWSGPAPSRTAVDADGNVYVGIRHFDSRSAEVVKILAEGGIDRNSSGTIETSTNSTPLASIDSNSNGLLDCDATTCESADERIAWAVPVGPVGGLGRSVCIDTDGDVWVGLYNTLQYYKISATDGTVLAGPITSGTNRPYGCIVDSAGTLWGANLGTSLLEIDTTTDSFVANHANPWADYGVAVGNGKVYLAQVNGPRTFTRFDPTTNTFTDPAAVSISTLGIAVDGNGDIVTGATGGGTLYKLADDGSVIWSAAQQAPSTEIRGVAVDANGDVWTIRRADNSVAKYRGSDGGHLGVFPVGNSPYTYSDATGLGFRTNTNPFGTWTVVYDSAVGGTPWGTISWTESVPTDATLEVEARAAESEGALEFQGWTTVSNGVPFSLAGRFIEIRATFTANDADESPILFDLTLAGEVTTTTSSTSTTSTTTTTIPVCGNGIPEGLEDCDDANTADGDCCSATCTFEAQGSDCSDGFFCNGAETCDGAGNCDPGAAEDCSHLDGECSDGFCDAEADQCDITALNEGLDCTHDATCTLVAECQGGECTPTEETYLAASCRWVVVGGKSGETVRVRTDIMSDQDANICGDALRISGRTTGSVVSALTTGDGIDFREGAVVGGHIVTDGAAVTSGGRSWIPGTDGLLTDVAGGQVIERTEAPGTYIDTTGSHDLAAECQVDQDSLTTAETQIDGLGSDGSLGKYKIKRSAADEIDVTGQGLAVLDADKITLGGRSTLTLRGLSTDVLILRMAGNLRLGYGALIILAEGAPADGLLPENVLFYSKGNVCRLGRGVEAEDEGGADGGGTIFCPNARKFKVGKRSVWTGSFLGARVELRVRGTNVTHREFSGT